jgi:chromosome segregation protein
MHIKKLEISGFKSFVDRTVVHFDHDVVAIVGPNGCGKSNIVDAIRWCLGEQSARHLRGRSMEDVIFNGSETRGPLGMAEVTLTFDNSDLEQAASLPIEYRAYPEVAVTRRLFRDGTSSYLLNKVEVRLKDVVDIFLGTGVGTKAYSIVEQGKIGLIVSARPEDRRALIEEAAGITKYKARKKASERKMELTEQNLLRVGDRVGELERSVASLQRQAAKAERYVSYRGELERLILHQASHQLLEIVANVTFWSAEKSTTEQCVTEARTELEGAEAALELDRAEALRMQDAAEEAQNEAFSADNQLRALEAELSRDQDRLEHLAKRFDAAGVEQSDLRSQAAALEVERGAVRESLAALERDEASEAEAALAEHEVLEGLREQERAAETALGELRQRASEASSQVAAARAKLSGLERRTQEMRGRKVKLSEETTALGAQFESLGRHRAELEGQVVELETTREQASTVRGELEMALSGLRQALLENEKIVDSERTLLAQQRGRLKALEDMRERLEGVGDGVKHLMATGDRCLLGLVVDRIQAPAELTAAVTGLLGGLLECVVVDDPERASALLSELATERKGRASVITQSPRRVVGRGVRAIDDPGVLGPLLDRLTFAPQDESLVAALVDDALLVDTEATARRLAAHADGRTLVALDGTVVYPSGRITGGSSDAVASELVDERREMRELSRACGELLASVEAKVQTHQELRARMAALGASLDEARQRLHEAEIALVSSQKDEKKTREQLASIEQRIASQTAELADIERHLAEATQEEADASQALAAGEASLHEAEAATEGALAEAAAWRQKVVDQSAVVTERKVRLARVREQAQGARSTVERLGRSHEELLGRVARLQEELTEIERQAELTREHVSEIRENVTLAAALAEEKKLALSEARRVFDEARTALGEREANLKTLRQALTDASERAASHELTLERLRMSHTHLLASVREKFRGLDLTRIVGDYHCLPIPDEQHRQRIVELTHLIDRMGPVNLDATREHNEEKERLTFFTDQKTDLEKALDDLRRAIAQMNRESRRLFRETFDSVNERFRALFPRLFSGGRAELHLTQPEDLLETGVEIIAQPPGKKLGNIELMSGGEKALTAVSLIFALFQHKPSPFCILDEVDAPLDEANVARYSELIRSMTDRSQFILITHVKRTMQSADVLYGVTMQEAGISRMVSVKVNESAQRRSGVPAASTEGEHVQVA